MKAKQILFTVMENGGVDTTVVNSRQHNMGQMADFPHLLASLTYKSMMYLKLNIRPFGTH
jgi:hypothetical protein